MGLNAEQRRRRRLSEVDGADRGGGGGVVVWGGCLPDNAKEIIDDSCCGRARNRTNQGQIVRSNPTHILSSHLVLLFFSIFFF